MNIKAAIIGMGIGQKHFDAIENYKGAKVEIICEKDKKKISQLKKKHPKKVITDDQNKIFENKEINLVSIASYDNFHFNQIIKAINNNKHIIVEKPMCMKFSELKKIHTLLNKKKKIKIFSNLVLRVNSLFKDFKKKTNIDKVFYIEADYIWGRKKKLFEWRSKVSDYSLTLGAGIHMIDLIIWITGLNPQSVYAAGNDKVTKNTNFKKDSLITMIFEFPKNILVKISANAVADYNHFHEIKIFSKDNTLINSNYGAYEIKGNKHKKLDAKYPDKKNRKKLIQNFLDSIKNKNVKPLISVKEQIDLMTICFAVDRSIKLKKKINIKYL